MYLSLAAAPERPWITGIADIAFKVSNIEAARNYYGHVLGYEEFSVAPGRAEDSTETFYYKVNDHQYIEIAAGLKDPNGDKLIHIGFETTDAQRLRDYLASRGVSVPAESNRGHVRQPKLYGQGSGRTHGGVCAVSARFDPEPQLPAT